MSRNVFLWALYDFANTPLTVAIGGLYLGQWIIVENHIEDFWFGLASVISTILLLVTAPLIGAWSDSIGKRMPFIRWSTVAFVISGIAIGLVATSTISIVWRVTVVLVIFVFAQYAYQASLISYNALLDKISKPHERSTISGIGQAFGELGWLLGPAMLLPFAAVSRGNVFLPATIVLIVLGLPMFLWFKEAKTKALEKVDLRTTLSRSHEGIKLLLKDRNLLLFMVGFMLISDALLTATLYFAVFLELVFKMTDFNKIVILVILEIVSASSAYIIGKIGDRRGVKGLLIVSAINLSLVYFVVALLPSAGWMIYVLGGFIGVGYGGFYATTRALLVKISPAQRLGEYFGFYTTFQRFASIIGPLTWGIIVFAFGSYGLVRYRIAIIFLVLMMFAGTIILTRVKETQTLRPA